MRSCRLCSRRSERRPTEALQWLALVRALLIYVVLVADVLLFVVWAGPQIDCVGYARDSFMASLALVAYGAPVAAVLTLLAGPLTFRTFPRLVLWPMCCAGILALLPIFLSSTVLGHHLCDGVRFDIDCGAEPIDRIFAPLLILGLLVVPLTAVLVRRLSRRRRAA